jgi:hypothetical protein
MLIAEQTSGSGDKAEFISRGLVVLYGGSTLGALVRSPSSTTASELVIYGAGSLKIHGNGVTGIMRADGGFQVGGSVAIDSARNFSGAQLNLTGDVIAGGKIRFSGTQPSTGVGGAVINGKFPVYDSAGSFLGWAYTFNG